MYEVEIYTDENGKSELADWIAALKRRKDRGVKEARIQFEQVIYCIERIRVDGTFVPEEIAKHIDEGIWELRPGYNRVMFFHFRNGQFILLNHFRKTTNETPAREIRKAKTLRNDWITRNL